MTNISAPPMKHNKAATDVPARSLPSWIPWVLLPARGILFALFQAGVALVFLLTGNENPWDSSTGYWPITVGLTNLVIGLLLIRLFRMEGKNYWDIFRFHKKHVKIDLLVLLGVTLLSGPVAFLPNLLLGNGLFGNQQIALDMFLRPLPTWADYASIALFPVTQGLIELPFYFLYLLPRLESQTKKAWLALTLPALMLGFQHAAAPLVFDSRFIAWRALMFVPFAFLAGITLRWRPRLMPYMAVVHVLMDLATAIMLLSI